MARKNEFRVELYSADGTHLGTYFPTGTLARVERWLSVELDQPGVFAGRIFDTDDCEVSGISHVERSFAEAAAELLHERLGD